MRRSTKKTRKRKFTTDSKQVEPRPYKYNEFNPIMKSAKEDVTAMDVILVAIFIGIVTIGFVIMAIKWFSWLAELYFVLIIISLLQINFYHWFYNFIESYILKVHNRVREDMFSRIVIIPLAVALKYTSLKIRCQLFLLQTLIPVILETFNHVFNPSSLCFIGLIWISEICVVFLINLLSCNISNYFSFHTTVLIAIALRTTYVFYLNFTRLEIHDYIGRGTYTGRSILRTVKLRCVSSSSFNSTDVSVIQKLTSLSNSIRHRNVVKIFSHFGNKHLLIMELMYQNLSNYLLRLHYNNNISSDKCIDSCCQISSGLKYLHEFKPNSILHGRLTPNNVMVNENGTVFKLCDFGLPRSTSITSQNSDNHLPPEWKVNRHATVTHNSDIWMLGILMITAFYHLKFVSHDHPIYPIFEDCLQLDPELRPTSDFVHTSMGRLRSKLHIDNINEFIKEDKIPVLEDDINPIGHGSYATVYRGKMRRKVVAIKKINKERLGRITFDSQSVEKTFASFRKEAEMLKLARHPNIVKFFGVFGESTKDVNILLVMELMVQDLWNFLKARKGSIKIAKQLDICYQMTSGLKYLHEMKPDPILHRDLTPANVLVNEDCTVFKLSDFGQAKFRPSPEAYLTSETPGNILYMPPEVHFDPKADKERTFSRKSDVFSLGVTMLQVATQSKPSCGVIGIRTQPEIERRASDISQLESGHPLKQIILNCLKDHPNERPDAGQILKAIHPFL